MAQGPMAKDSEPAIPEYQRQRRCWRGGDKYQIQQEIEWQDWRCRRSARFRDSEAMFGSPAKENLDRTPAAARSSGAPPEPGRTFRCGLLARCAGVHVDFHAHRHFDDFRSLPSHSGSSQLVWRDVHAGAEPRAPSDAAQVWNIDGTTPECRT